MPDFTPGKSTSKDFGYIDLNSIDKVEIDPVIYDSERDDYLVCKEAIISQDIENCP